MTLTVSGNSSSNSSIRLMDSTSGSVAAPLVDALPTSEQSLLAKLEAANKLIESDAKSLNSLQSSAHSRKSSDTSQISLNSGKIKIQVENWYRSQKVEEIEVFWLWLRQINGFGLENRTKISPNCKNFEFRLKRLFFSTSKQVYQLKRTFARFGRAS